VSQEEMMGTEVKLVRRYKMENRNNTEKTAEIEVIDKRMPLGDGIGRPVPTTEASDRKKILDYFKRVREVQGPELTTKEMQDAFVGILIDLSMVFQKWEQKEVK